MFFRKKQTINILKMKLYTKILTALFILVFALSSCGSDDEVVPNFDVSKLTKIKEVVIADLNATVLVYSDEALFVGYNNLYIAVSDASQNLIKNASIVFKPKMQMPDMAHSSPVVNPSAIDEEMGLYKGAAVFIMPSGEMGSWTLELQITVGEVTASTTFDVNVITPEETRVQSFVTDNNTKIFVALVSPSKPEVGINDFTLFVAKKESMMSFPALTGLSFEITPEMPTMGHGSPNNVNPTSNNDGFYSGKVNFTMTGFWEVHLKISEGNTVIKEDVTFDITF